MEINNSIGIDINWIKKSYLEIIDLLKEKYGKIDKPYFNNNINWIPNSKIKRTKEGLFIHHVLENQYIMLSTKEYAIKASWEAQLGHNLVYCNWLEHLLLHIKIVDEYLL